MAIVAGAIAFIQAHEAWAVPIVGLLAFGESLAFISLLLPATVILLGLGGLIGEAHLPFWPLWAAAAVGAMLGDWLSFAIARHFGPAIADLWPLNGHPGILARGQRFFRRWGLAGVFLGRFFGPLRAAIPLAAGICGMRPVPFQAANIASALIWAGLVLAPGAFGLPWLARWFGG